MSLIKLFNWCKERACYQKLYYQALGEKVAQDWELKKLREQLKVQQALLNKQQSLKPKGIENT